MAVAVAAGVGSAVTVGMKVGLGGGVALGAAVQAAASRTTGIMRQAHRRGMAGMIAWKSREDREARRTGLRLLARGWLAYNAGMRGAAPVPLWLWRAAAWTFGAALLGVAGLAGALATGLADPPRAGALRWADDFQSGLGRWSLAAHPEGTLLPNAGGLSVDFSAADQWAAALTAPPTGDFTLEMGGAQTGGDLGAYYGVTFGWGDAQNYSAALINGNGYAVVFTMTAGERHEWFALQQWPHILVGGEGNRVRVDVQGARVTVRVNDERVTAFEMASTPAGLAGPLAQSTGAGWVQFNWVRLWAP
jgi:hypothetical protein